MTPPPPPSATAVDLRPRTGHSITKGSSSGRRSNFNWRAAFRWFGPGYLVAVGYMDPGNWATGIAGGSAFGYDLLFVVMLASIVAMLLQSLAAKLGIVTGLDLAQACRERYSKPVRMLLWLLCELAIIACDLAEVLGTAIALKLLFGLPIFYGILLTTFDVMLLLALQRSGFRKLEAFVIALMATIATCFAVEFILAKPALDEIGRGLIPSASLLSDPAMLYLSMGIIGATVMPHNLYLHSSLVKTRMAEMPGTSKRQAIRFATVDSTVALTLAFLINAAILILAAAAFHAHGRTDVASIEDAHSLLAPLLGASIASPVFAIGLLAAGQNATLTGTLAGQVVLEGFTDWQMQPWLRRLISRLLAVVPAAGVAIVYGEGGTERLLILSQVILSLQLPFAIVPLLMVTGDRAKMGQFANGTMVRLLGWISAGLLIALNLKLVFDVAFGTR